MTKKIDKLVINEQSQIVPKKIDKPVINEQSQIVSKKMGGNPVTKSLWQRYNKGDKNDKLQKTMELFGDSGFCLIPDCPCYRSQLWKNFYSKYPGAHITQLWEIYNKYRDQNVD